MMALGPLAALAVLAACGEGEPRADLQPAGTPPPSANRNFPGRSYERNFVFTTVGRDSSFLVPWLLMTTTRPGTVVREARGWLSRSGVWEAFFSERWETPPTRSPARVLPHNDLRFVVREGDAVDGIIFDDGPRNLEVGLGNVLAQWAGPKGEVLQLLEGSLYLSERRIGGLVLDMARGSSAESPPGGDWAFCFGQLAVTVLVVCFQIGGFTGFHFCFGSRSFGLGKLTILVGVEFFQDAFFAGSAGRRALTSGAVTVAGLRLGCRNGKAE